LIGYILYAKIQKGAIDAKIHGSQNSTARKAVYEYPEHDVKRLIKVKIYIFGLAVKEWINSGPFFLGLINQTPTFIFLN